jgi:hypothetical protein
MVSYWDKRVEIFGPEKAFQPLSQAEALKDDTAALSLDFMRLLGTKDPSGRNVVFADPSHLDKKVSTESTARAVWYVMHAAVEDEDTQKRGIILMVYPARAKFAQFNRELMKVVAGSIKGCSPGKSPPNLF